MIAEPISARVIRMFPPSSVFLALRPIRPSSHYVPDVLPPMETGGCEMRSSECVEWLKIHGAPSRSLKRRAHLMRMIGGFGKTRVTFAE
jgi:hypothetical protein